MTRETDPLLPNEEAEWIRAAQSGDRDAFAQLLKRYWDRLYRWLYHLTRDRHAAEDLTQETFLKALGAMHSFRPGTNFRAWIYRILRNSFLSSRTGLKTTVVLDEEDQETISAAGGSTPESLVIAQSNRETVQSALAELPVPFREILLLCEVEEMSYQEIAQTLAIPTGTVMSRLSRARKALRELLQQKFAGGSHGV